MQQSTTASRSGSAAMGLPRTSSLSFTSIPGTFWTPPPRMSAGMAKRNSKTWLAGSAGSLLRRSDQATEALRSGMVISPRSSLAPPSVPGASAVPHTTDPLNLRAGGSCASSS